MKRATGVSLDFEAVIKAKQLGINISEVCNQALIVATNTTFPSNKEDLLEELSTTDKELSALVAKKASLEAKQLEITKKEEAEQEKEAKIPFYMTTRKDKWQVAREELQAQKDKK